MTRRAWPPLRPSPPGSWIAESPPRLSRRSTRPLDARGDPDAPRELDITHGEHLPTVQVPVGCDSGRCVKGPNRSGEGLRATLPPCNSVCTHPSTLVIGTMRG